MSEQSQSIVQATAEDVPIGGPPGVKAKAISTSALRVTWEPMPKSVARGEIVSYRIDYRNHNDTDFKTLEIPIAEAAPVFRYTIGDLQPGATYDVRVIGATSAGYPTLDIDDNIAWATVDIPSSGVSVADDVDFQSVTTNTINSDNHSPRQSSFSILSFSLVFLFLYVKLTHCGLSLCSAVFLPHTF